jgi:hypothetical protein
MNQTASHLQLAAQGTKRRKCNYRGVAATKLERFIRARELFPSEVAMASNVCRQRLQAWRYAKASPMLSSIRRLVRGMRKVTGDPTIKAHDLFPLDDR